MSKLINQFDLEVLKRRGMHVTKIAILHPGETPKDEVTTTVVAFGVNSKSERLPDMYIHEDMADSISKKLEAFEYYYDNTRVSNYLGINIDTIIKA